MIRRFELATKFWEVGVAKSRVTVRFGRIGASGETKLKDPCVNFESEVRVEATTIAALRFTLT